MGLVGPATGYGVSMPPTRAPSAAPPRPAPAPGTMPRWDSLDVLRGLALCGMVAHHFAKWTGERVGERFVGWPGFVVTDLAAPMFAVGVGAAALLVGHQVRGDRRRLGRATFRWGQVLALGLVLDLAVGGGIDGGGVLPTLAVLGTVVMLLTMAGLHRPWQWWGIAAGCALAAVPVTRLGWTGFLGELWSGSFSVVVYGLFAAAGAGLAASARPAGERALPLLRAAGAVLVVGVLARLAIPQWVAPDGIWVPRRHPGDLAFTLWGLVGTLVVWAVVRRTISVGTRLGAGLARAGRRTLLVFGGHYLVKLVLQRADLLGELDTRAWGLAAWAAAGVVCAAAMLPWRTPER